MVVVVVVVRGVKEGPELGPHRQGGNRGCSRQEQHCQRSVLSGAVNAKDRKNLNFLPRVLGSHTEHGTERGVDRWEGLPSPCLRQLLLPMAWSGESGEHSSGDTK